MFRLFKNHIYNHISNARNKNTWKFSIAKYVYRVGSGVETASRIFSLKAKFQTRLQVTLPIKFLEIPKPICTIQVLCFQPVHDSCVRLIVSIHWPFSRVTKHGLHLVPRPNVVHTLYSCGRTCSYAWALYTRKDWSVLLRFQAPRVSPTSRLSFP